MSGDQFPAVYFNGQLAAMATVGTREEREDAPDAFWDRMAFWAAGSD